MPYEKVGNNEPVCIADELPFEIPDSWKWVRLKDVAFVNGGYAFKSADYTKDGTRVIRISDFNESGFINTKTVRHPYNSTFEMFLLEEKNILLCMTGGTVGKSYFIKTLDEPMMTNQRVATIKIFGALEDYINLLILSPVTQKVINESKNSTNDNISMDAINGFNVPLPPLEEQKRIVKKYVELETYIEKYTSQELLLNNLDKGFPELLKKSILQEGIQGKLVPQDPADEPASVLLERIRAEKEQLIKAGKIKRDKHESVIFRRDNSYYEKRGISEICINDKLPFDIPKTWEWVRLGSICEIARGASPRPIKAFLTNDPNGINWIKIGDTEKGGKHINSAKEKIIPEGVSKSRMVYSGDLLLTNSMSFGHPYILNIDGCIHDGWLVLSGYECAYERDFLFYMLSSHFAYSQFCDVVSGAVVKNLNSGKVAAALFPLPPKHEQKRIVKELSRILSTF